MILSKHIERKGIILRKYHTNENNLKVEKNAWDAINVTQDMNLAQKWSKGSSIGLDHFYKFSLALD